jgi:TfoX/Sxy family transcriptional regulator of competence genes
LPYDEGLAQRIREQLEDDPRVSEKKMFGGVAFFVNGRMTCGIIRDELMVRVGPEAHAEAVAQPHARPMDFTKRPMRGFVQVAPAGFESDSDLASWIARGVRFAESSAEAPRRPGAAAARKRSVARARPKPAAKRKPKSAPKRSPR